MCANSLNPALGRVVLRKAMSGYSGLNVLSHLPHFQAQIRNNCRKSLNVPFMGHGLGETQYVLPFLMQMYLREGCEEHTEGF